MLDVTTALPLLMDWYDRYDDESSTDPISKETFLSMIDALESFVIRRSILRERTRGYGSDFAQAKKSRTVNDLLSYFSQRGWPSDSEVQEALVTFELYSKEKNKTRLILEELERSFGHRELVDLNDPNVISIEHIMPQADRLPDAWKNMLGENACEIHEKYRHSIGNLTLTGYNRELGKKSLYEKKQVYATKVSGSRLALNDFVLQQEQWTEYEICERARQLSKRFVEIWPRAEVGDGS